MTDQKGSFKVSLIVPVYNVEKFLPKCLNAILAQTWEEMEIILVDDGSTDRCPQICDAYAGLDSRIYVIHQENSGVSAARNAGLDAASGEWVLFVDPDDYPDPDYVGNMLEMQIACQTDFVYCSMYLTEGEKDIPKRLPLDTGVYTFQDVYKPIFFGNMSTSMFLGLFRRMIIEREKIRFDPSIRKSEDWLFYSLYLPCCESVAILNKPLYHYVQNEQSVMHEYYVPSEAGVEKGLYILDTFRRNMEKGKVPKAWYDAPLNARYVTAAVRYAVGYWDSRNRMGWYQKHKAIRLYIDQVRMYDRIQISPAQMGGARTVIEFMIVKSRSAVLLDLYAILYHTGRRLRDLIRK